MTRGLRADIGGAFTALGSYGAETGRIADRGEIGKSRLCATNPLVR